MKTRFQVEDGKGLARFVGRLTEVQLPPTVQGVLAARINRLPGEEKAGKYLLRAEDQAAQRAASARNEV